jgi:hypothetical protein
MTSIANRYLRIILHEPNYNSWPFCGLYPLIPWIGVMGLGWCFGDVIRKLQVPFSKLRNAIFLTGVSSITLFFIVRWLRSFGNLLPRRGNTLIDWLYVSKYPPSVAFLLWGLGGMCIFLSIGLWIQENDIKNRLSDAILDIGKVPLFYYLTHLWLFRFRLPTPPPPAPPPYPLEMWQTLIFWVVGNIILWQLCKRYYMFKREHPDSPLKYI